MINLERKISLYALIVFLFIGILGAILFGASVLHVIKGGKRLGGFGERVLAVAQFPSTAKKVLTSLSKGGSNQIINDSRFKNINGFYVNNKLPIGVKKDSGYLLVSSYDERIKQSSVQLIKINTQKIIKEWVPNIEELKKIDVVKEKYSQTPAVENFRIVHPLLLKNGGLVFNNGYGAYGVDICSEKNLFLEGTYHHSNELDSEGNIWTPSVIYPHSYDYLPSFRDDAITQFSPSGNILFKKSVATILVENGYRGLLAVGDDIDPIHLNDIQPALTDSKYWNKGDLLLSLRQRSTVMLYRPSTNKVLWLKTGPWMNQHDVNFIGDKEISIFGNNVIDFGKDRELFDGYNSIYRYNFKDNTLSLPKNRIMKEIEVKTKTEGRGKILTNGEIFIEETNSGRVLKLGNHGVEWEFVKRINENTLSMVSWTRYLTESDVTPILSLLRNTSCEKDSYEK